MVFGSRAKFLKPFLGQEACPRASTHLGKGEPGTPGNTPERAERSHARGRAIRELPLRNVASNLMNVAGGHPRETDRKRAGGMLEPGTTVRKRPWAGLQACPGMEGAGEKE